MNPKTILTPKQTKFFLVMLIVIQSAAASPSSLRGGLPTYDSISSSIESELQEISKAYSSTTNAFRNLLSGCNHNIFLKEIEPVSPSPITSPSNCDSAEYYPLKCKKQNDDGQVVMKIYNDVCSAELDGWEIDDECSFIEKCFDKPMRTIICNGTTFHNRCLAKRSSECNGL